MTTNAQAAYSKHKVESWSRVDMLLALYDSGITSISAAEEAERTGDSETADKLRMKALRVIQGLIAGLDLNQGEVPKQMLRLFEYMHHAIHTRQPGHLESARNILTSLHESFQEIRTEAIALEKNGEIPSLETTRFQFTA